MYIFFFVVSGSVSGLGLILFLFFLLLFLLCFFLISMPLLSEYMAYHVMPSHHSISLLPLIHSRYAYAQVYGTPDYIAPEVILGQVKPSIFFFVFLSASLTLTLSFKAHPTLSSLISS
jgi:serine/threonine protein kinase